MKKLLLGVCTFAVAVAVLAAPLTAASAATADEVTDPTSVQQVEETAPPADTTQAPAEVAEIPEVPAPEVVPTTPAEQPAQEPAPEVQTTDAQPQAPPVAAKTKPVDRKVTICHVPPGNPENAQTIEVDANGWNGHDNHKGDYEGACKPAYQITPKGFGITCTDAWIAPGRALTNGDHINIDVVVNGVKQQRNAYVDRNIAGGYDTLGLRINTGSGQVTVPLSAEAVKTGKFSFNFGQYVSGSWTVEWAQFNSSYFNQDRNSGNFLTCGKPVEPPFQVKEVCATWETTSINADWPQKLLSKDCGFIPEQRCEPYKIQFDKYWIRDAADQKYYDGLTVLNSPADDASLEPHGYYLKTIEAKDCRTPVIGQPVITINGPTCESNDVNVSWNIPDGLSIAGYTGSGTKTAAELGLSVGDNTFPVDVAQGYRYDGPATVTVKVPPIKTDQECTVVVPPRHNANANGEYACGTAEVTLYNQQGPRESTLTASFVIYVDGKFHSAHAVLGGEQEVVKFSFPEDSGNHQIIVRTGPAQGDEFVFSMTVPSDCIPPQPEPKVTKTEWTDGAYVCGDKTVTQTRVVTTTTFKWDGKAYVEDKVTTDTETKTRDLMEQERQDACVKPEPTSGTDKRDTTPVCVEPNNGTATVEHQERTWTQTPVWTGDKWELGEKQYTEWETVDTSIVDSEDCIPTKPKDLTEFSNWSDGKFECDATEVPQTRTKSVTTFVWNWDTHTWEAQKPVITTETGSRPLTAEEQEAADIECAGPQPENEVVYGDWVTGEFECGDTTVQITRTVTSTEFVREGSEWVEGESATTTQTETRDLTAEEIASLECPVVVPPTEEPPVETPKPTPAPSATTKAAAKSPVQDNGDKLAATGTDGGTIFGFSLLGFSLLAGATALIVGARRKARSLPVKSEEE